jgi:TolA-binding protein
MLLLLQVIVLAALAATLYIMRGAEASNNNRVCDNESRVKLSMLHGLHEQHKMKEVRILEFEREVDEVTNEAKRKVFEAESSVVKMQGQVNETRDEAEEIMTQMDNITSPELEELEEQQICSDELFVTDCCQVINASANKVLLPHLFLCR